MDARPRVDKLFGIRPRFIDVQVTGIRTLNDQPLTVRCLKPDPAELAAIVRRHPGARSAEKRGNQAFSPEEADARLFDVAPLMIARWTAVQWPDTGEWQSPAFALVESEENAHLLPTSELTYLDLGNLALAIMKLGGYPR